MARARLENLDRPDSLAQRAYSALRTAVRNGALVQGETYSEAEISSSMGISRTPVREALIELSREGLVEIIPQRGFRLRVMTVEEQQEVFALRAVLEALVVEQLAGTATAKDVAELRRYVKGQQQVLGDPVEFLTLDEQFHLAMPRLAGLERTHKLLATLRGAMWLIGASALQIEDRGSTVLVEHAAIVDAIDRNDGPAAAAAMQHHLRSTASATHVDVPRRFGVLRDMRPAESVLEATFGKESLSTRRKSATRAQVKPAT